MLGDIGLDALARSLLLLALYGIPSIVAWRRRHHNRAAIILVNLLLGWTGLGWIAALIWASTNPPPKA